MNVQTTSTNNGSVIKSNQESNHSNELIKSSSTSNPSQPAQHPQSQLEITGVSRSSHPVTSQKESNRFRIVKTDADRKNEPIDDNQNLSQANDHGVSQAKFTDVNTMQAKNVFNNYQRGRWYVAEFSTENLPSTKLSNQAGQTNSQSQFKNEEPSNNTNVAPNQPNQINQSTDQTKAPINTSSNGSTAPQSQSNNNSGTNSNHYISNQIYHQSAQTPAQTYQKLNQASSSNFSQPAQKISNANNNLVSNISQIGGNQSSNQTNQSNATINNQHTDNTQGNNQPNFPSQTHNKSVNVQTISTKENISVGTQANSLINSQIPAAPQASPKDLTNENLQFNTNDSDAATSDQTHETNKADSGIHDKIAEAMDMVKSHLTQAVRDEIVTLKNQIKSLREQCSRLEQENRVLKKNMPSDILRQLESIGIFSYNSNMNGISESDNRTQDNMLSSFTEKVINKNDFLNNLQSSSK